MAKLLIGTTLALGLVLFGFSESGYDYTQAVANSERLSRVFEGKNVSNPNGFQVVLIELCYSIMSCGNE